MIGLGLDGYEPDSGHESAIAFRIRVVEAEQYIPAHSHRKGQLILALHGALTCEVENAMWMVPPQYAVWVPGQLSHSNRDPARWQTLSQWAAVFAMSERNLARLVVRETGLSFRRWRHQLQLILALQLLIRGQTVQQTAQALGYDSTTAFITMFKKGLGQTPGRYHGSLATTSQ